MLCYYVLCSANKDPIKSKSVKQIMRTKTLDTAI